MFKHSTFIKLILTFFLRLFNHDIVAVLLVFFFALSNGYVGSMSMALGPQKVLLTETEVAGTIMVSSHFSQRKILILIDQQEILIS